MMLNEFYQAVGGDAKVVLERLGGSEMLVRRFLAKFKDDKSYAELTEALEADNIEKAFRAAHTLKGVCANLGLQSLYAVASDITETLRPRAEGAVDAAKTKLPELQKEYDAVLAALEKL